MNSYQKENNYKAMSGKPGEYRSGGFIPNEEDPQTDSVSCLAETITLIIVIVLVAVVLAVLSIM